GGGMDRTARGRGWSGARGGRCPGRGPTARAAARVHAGSSVWARPDDRPGASGGGPGRRVDRIAGDCVRLHRPAGYICSYAPKVTMSNTRKILLAIAGFYVFGIVLLLVLFGFSQHKNNAFQIQNEFKLVNWLS